MILNSTQYRKMFGDGIYFASESDKSMGYTNSGRWVGGNSAGRVFMALYNVHLGKQYCTPSSDSSLSVSKLQRLGDYDSTWGQKGIHFAGMNISHIKVINQLFNI